MSEDARIAEFRAVIEAVMAEVAVGVKRERDEWYATASPLERIASDVLDHVHAESDARADRCALWFMMGCHVYGAPEFLPEELRS